MRQIAQYAALLGLLAASTPSVGQPEVVKITLPNALTLAHEQSLDALVARNELKVAYWQLRSYKADLLPGIALEGTLPNINRSVSSYQNSDGSYSYVRNNAATTDLSVNIDQNIPLTGGHISVISQLQRIDQLGSGSSKQYMGLPVGVTFEQPLVSFNKLKWMGRIEPLKYEEAMRRYSANMEMVHVKTISYYFDLLMAKVNNDIAVQNLLNATKLYDIAVAKKEIGIISENELLQLRLSKLNFEARVTDAKQEFDKKMFALRNFLGFNDKVMLQPEVPVGTPAAAATTSLAEVLSLARANNPFTQEVQRRMLETQMLVAEAKASRGFKADLFLSFGLTGNDVTLPGAYQNLQDRQMARLGVRIPILDWGKGRGKVELAKSQLEVQKGRIQQESQSFEQNVFISVQQLLAQPRQLSIAQEADSVAQQRYKTAFETFVMGKINILDINDAQVSRDEAKRNHLAQLYASWLYYYNLRQITLYDFEKRQNITSDANGLL